MKTTSKKRMLISSVAMLLLAMLSLGTATFAWFTSSTSATANNINVRTTKSSELKVSKSDFQFADTISYGMTSAKTLRPVSSADGSNWYYATAAAKDKPDAKTGTYSTAMTATSTDIGNYAFIDMLNIKNAGGSDCKNVQIEVTASMPSTFARLAIVPCATSQSAAVDNENPLPTITAADFKANIYGSAKGRTWKPYNGTAVETTAFTTKDVANSSKITIQYPEKNAETDKYTHALGTLKPNEVVSYMIIVWFEGEDADCFDTTTADLTVPSISFTVTGSSSN